jgi:deoxyhypusine synthase
MGNNDIYNEASANVLQPTNKEAKAKLLEQSQSEQSWEIKGYDLNKGIDYDKILKSYLTTGFQATNFGNAVKEINKMVN